MSPPDDDSQKTGAEPSRGAIGGTSPHAAARRLQSMPLPHFLCLCVCVCLFATGGPEGGLLMAAPMAMVAMAVAVVMMMMMRWRRRRRSRSFWLSSPPVF